MKPSEAHFKRFPSATRTTRQTAYSITQRQQGTLWKGVESDIKLGTVGEGKAKGANLIVHMLPGREGVKGWKPELPGLDRHSGGVSEEKAGEQLDQGLGLGCVSTEVRGGGVETGSSKV